MDSNSLGTLVRGQGSCKRGAKITGKHCRSVSGASRAMAYRRERIQKLKELVELREIGKVLQSIYMFKGDFLGVC